MEQQPTNVSVREGFVVLDGRRQFVRLDGARCAFTRSEGAEPGGAVSGWLPLSELGTIVGATEAETQAWKEDVSAILRFHAERDAVIVSDMPNHVRGALLPQVEPPPPSSALTTISANSLLRVHVRSLVGTSTTVSGLSRALTVAELKQRLAADGLTPDAAATNLIFGAAVLSNEATLANVPDDAVLFIVVRKGLVSQPQPQAAAAPAAAAVSALDSEVVGKLLPLANQMLAMGDFSGAHRAAEKALQILEGRRTPQVVACLVTLGAVAKKRAQYEDALRLYRQGLALARELNDTEQLAALHLQLGDVHRKLEAFEEAGRSYDEALQLARKLDLKKVVVSVLVGKGLIEKKFSRYDAAKALYDEALKLEKKGTAKWAEIAYNAADVFRKQEKFADAKRLYLEALAVIEAVLGPHHAEVAEVCNALAMLQKKEGGYADAQQNYERALAIVAELFGPNHPKIGIYSVNLGDIFRKLGDFVRAEAAYARALPLLEAALGPDNVEVAEACNSQGLVLKKRADYDGAEVLYQRAIAIVLKTYNKQHYKYGMYMNNLADCYRKRGQYDTALAMYNDAIAALTASLGATHSETGECFHNVGLVLHQLGRYGEAVDLFLKALEIVKKEFGPAHYKVGVFSNNAGMSYAMLGDYSKAYALLKLALGILIAKLGKSHVEVGDCLTYLGDVCMKLFVQMNATDKLSEAREHYTEANAIALAAFGPSHPKALSCQSLLAICSQQAEQANRVDERPIELVEVVLYDISQSMSTKTKLSNTSVMDRREISKAFFGAFIDKLVAYEYPHALGLITFGEAVKVELDVTRSFESFAALFGQISQLQPATHCWDAVVLGCEVIERFCARNAAQLAPKCRKRILCLSDGEDGTSKHTLLQAFQALQRGGIVFDSVPIEGAHGRMRALSNVSGGLCFSVRSFADGISLFEREAVLSLRHRRPHVVPAVGPAIEKMEAACEYSVDPEVIEPPLLRSTLARRGLGAAGAASSAGRLSPEQQKRLLAELADVLREPVAGFEVVPSGDELTFWCVVWTGSGLYEGRAFTLYLDLGLFPLAPPELRFHTPVFHCNVNNDGRVCLDVLSSRSWSPQVRVRDVLRDLAALMANPNAFSAIDSVKGQLFRDNRREYQDRARAFAAQHGQRIDAVD